MCTYSYISRIHHRTTRKLYLAIANFVLSHCESRGKTSRWLNVGTVFNFWMNNYELRWKMVLSIYSESTPNRKLYSCSNVIWRLRKCHNNNRTYYRFNIAFEIVSIIIINPHGSIYTIPYKIYYSYFTYKYIYAICT